MKNYSKKFQVRGYTYRKWKEIRRVFNILLQKEQEFLYLTKESNPSDNKASPSQQRFKKYSK